MSSLSLLEPIVKIEEAGSDGEEDPLAPKDTRFKKDKTDVEEVVHLSTPTHMIISETLSTEIIDLADDGSNSNDYTEQSTKPKRVRKRYPPKPEAPSTCDMCGQQFKTQKNLKHHIRRHTGERPYMCTTCGKTYTQIGHLQNHAVIHTNEKKFECSACDKSFFRRTELVRHEKIHSGDKPFKCTVCSKKFLQKANMQMHVKTHYDDRAHQCTFCCKRFMTRSKLMLHLNRHTKKMKTELGLPENYASVNE